MSWLDIRFPLPKKIKFPTLDDEAWRFELYIKNELWNENVVPCINIFEYYLSSWYVYVYAYVVATQT